MSTMPSEHVETEKNNKTHTRQELINMVLCQANEISHALYYFKVKSRDIHRRIQNQINCLELYTDLCSPKNRENSSENFIKAIKDLNLELKKVTFVIAEVRKFSNTEGPLSKIADPNPKLTLNKLQTLTNALFYKTVHMKWCSSWLKTEKLQKKAIADLFNTILQEEACVQPSPGKHKHDSSQQSPSLSDVISEMNTMIQKLTFKSDDEVAQSFEQKFEPGLTNSHNETKPQYNRLSRNRKANFFNAKQMSTNNFSSSDVSAPKQESSQDSPLKVEPPIFTTFGHKPVNNNETGRPQANGLPSNPRVYMFGAKPTSSNASVSIPQINNPKNPMTKPFEAKPTTSNSVNIPKPTQESQKFSSKMHPPFKTFDSKPENISKPSNQANGPPNKPRVYLFGQEPKISEPTQAPQEPSIKNEVNEPLKSEKLEPTKNGISILHAYQNNPMVYLFGVEPKISDVSPEKASQESSINKVNEPPKEKFERVNVINRDVKTSKNITPSKPSVYIFGAKETISDVSTPKPASRDESSYSGVPLFNKAFESQPTNMNNETSKPPASGSPSNPSVYIFDQEPMQIDEKAHQKTSQDPIKLKPNQQTEPSRPRIIRVPRSPITKVFDANALGTSHVKFIPPIGTDVIKKYGTVKKINVRYQFITSNNHFKNKSLEELRLEDYIAGHRGASSNVFKAQSESTTTNQASDNSKNTPTQSHESPKQYRKEQIQKAETTTQNCEITTKHGEIPVQHRDTPTQHRETSAQHHETPTQHPETPAQHCETPAQHRETSAQHRETPAQHRETPAQHSETPAQHRETPTQHRETSAQHCDTPAQHRETPTQHRETPTQHRETSAQHCDTPAQHRDTPAQHRETPTQHRETSAQHCDTPAQHRETPTQHRETSAQHCDTPAQHRETPTQHRETPTQHRETPTQDPETSTQHGETPAHRETPTQNREAQTEKGETINQNYETTQHSEIPAEHRETIKQYWERISNLKLRVSDEDAATLERLLEDGETYKAIRMCNDILIPDPKNVFFLVYRARAYYELKKYREALEDSQKAVGLSPNLPAIGYVTIAKCYLALDKIAPGEQAIRLALQIDPSVDVKELRDAFASLRTEQERVQSCISQQNYYDAVHIIDHCLKNHCPASSIMKIMKAECLAHMRKYEEARDIIFDLSNMCSKAESYDDFVYSDSMYIVGLCYNYQENDEMAAKFFRIALERDPDHEKAMKMFKLTKTRMNNKLIKQKKERGNFFFKTGEWRTAMSFYDEALSIDKNNKEENAKLHYNRATVFAKQNQLRNSIDACTAALELDGNYIKALLRRAQCYKDMDMYEEALDDYEKLYYIDSTEENKCLLDEANSALNANRGPYYYYKVLGIDKNATQDDIKKAYKKCALRCHPDRHAGSSLPEVLKYNRKFKLLKEAYDTLGDPTSRANYDCKRSFNHYSSSSSDEYENGYYRY